METMAAHGKSAALSEPAAAGIGLATAAIVAIWQSSADPKITGLDGRATLLLPLFRCHFSATGLASAGMATDAMGEPATEPAI